MSDELEALHPDLAAHVTTVRGIGAYVKHPLFFGPVSPTVHALYNRGYARKREKLARFEADGDFAMAVAMYERPYRMRALLGYRDRLSGPKLWKLVAEVYADSENIREHREEWLALFIDAMPHREDLMTAAERNHLAGLPDEITIYRGIRSAEHAKGALGFSWTLDADRGCWFAKRFPSSEREGYLLTATVARADVIAYWRGRGEDEVIVLPSSVRNLHARKV